MKKTHPLLSPFYSQHAVSARVYLTVQKSYSVTPLHHRNHNKSIGIDRNLHPLAVLPLTERHPRRCSGALQSP